VTVGAALGVKVNSLLAGRIVLALQSVSPLQIDCELTANFPEDLALSVLFGPLLPAF